MTQESTTNPESEALVLPDMINPIPLPVEDVVVLARNPQEMLRAQEGLVQWAIQKVALEKAALEEFQENYRLAKELKHRTTPWKRQVQLAEGRVLYYTKFKEALEHGYCIVPSFDDVIQIIAVRTDKKVSNRVVSGRYSADNVSPTYLPSGDGNYVNPVPMMSTWTEEEKNPTNGNTYRKSYTKAVCHGKVDFPMRLIKPQILQDLGEAMKLKIFDDFGILPPTSRRSRDPMVVGRVRQKVGPYSYLTVTFLITWWIDTRSL